MLRAGRKILPRGESDLSVRADKRARPTAGRPGSIWNIILGWVSKRPPAHPGSMESLAFRARRTCALAALYLACNVDSGEPGFPVPLYL